MTHHWGYVGAVSAAILFGLSSTLNKIALADVHPLIVAGLIYFIAGVFLFVVRLSPLHDRILELLETPTKTEPVMMRKEYGILGFVTISGAVLAPFLFVYGLNQTTAVNASLLLNMESLFTALIALVFFKERGVKKDYLGIVLLIIGAVFITTGGEFQNLTLAKEIVGNMLIVLACLFWGIDNNLSKMLSKKRDLPHLVALKCLTGGAIVLVSAALLQVNFQVPIFSLPYLFSVGAFSIGFSIVLFVFALREIGSMKTGVIYSTSSFFGAVFAFIVLRETFTAVQLIAGLIMLLGVYILYRKPQPSKAQQTVKSKIIQQLSSGGDVMPTKPLYLYDSYVKEFDAKILSVVGNQITLDQTAFHPLTGGVAHDTGYLTKGNMKYTVAKVEINKETKDITHTVEEDTSNLHQGDVVNGIVDWQRRYRLMRLHTAAHLIATIMYSDYNALITGGQVDPEHAKLDFNLPRTDREIFEAAVEKATKEAGKSVQLKIYFLARDEALKMPGIVKLAEKMPPHEKELRIVEIPGIDIQADGGPHVKNTNEIGEIRLLKIENKGKNQRRVYFDVK